MDNELVTYDVYSNCTGQLYLGTDEAMADAAYQRMVDYVDNDEACEPIRVRYLANGVLLHTYTSPSYSEQYHD